VLETVSRVLEQAARPMRARVIHAPAEEFTREALRRTSVKAALGAAAASPTPLFERIRHGIYQQARR
jgi:hypothetical protein